MADVITFGGNALRFRPWQLASLTTSAAAPQTQAAKKNVKT